MFVLSLCIIAYAADSDDQELLRSGYEYDTIYDSDYNRYYVLGNSVVTNHTASVMTYFKNTYVYDGTIETQN